MDRGAIASPSMNLGLFWIFPDYDITCKRIIVEPLLYLNQQVYTGTTSTISRADRAPNLQLEQIVLRTELTYTLMEHQRLALILSKIKATELLPRLSTQLSD